jgi:long-chain fatty acid transport protein
MLAPLVLTNETTVDGSGLFTDGDETNADMPALLGIGLSYLAMPSLNIAVDYNMYFNEDANWDGKEDDVDNGSEIAVGVEFALSDALTLSGGYLMATSGATPAYQTDLSYSLNSNTIGAGLKYTLNPQMAISLGFSTTIYEEGEKSGVLYMDGLPTGTETYLKDATSFAIGLQKSF